jgi:drug/metabolite transporter (DMT)-like permease
MGLLYIALSVTSSLLIAHFLKVARKADQRLLNVLVINYITATIFSLMIVDKEALGQTELSFPMLFLGAFLGFIFIANLLVYSSSLHRIGMGISIASMRMSLVIPIALSLLIYGEHIGLLKYAGIVLVFIALYLMLPKLDFSHIEGVKDTVFPLLLFLMTGIADSSLKVYEREFTELIPEYGFLSLIFVCSFIFGMIVITYKKELSFTRKEIFYGIIIGVTNLYSSFFLILALRELSGSVVFSIVNVSNVIFGAIIGYILWKDELNNKQKIGIGVAGLSILLLIR